MSEHESSLTPSAAEKLLMHADVYDLSSDAKIEDMKFVTSEAIVDAHNAELAEPTREVEPYGFNDTVAVKRSSGEIDTGWKVVESGVVVNSRNGGEPKTGVVVEKEVNGEFLQKRVSYESLQEAGEALRAQTAVELGEDALDALEIEDPSDAVEVAEVAEVAAVETSVVEAPVVVETVQTAETDEAKAAESARNLMGIQNEAPAEPTPEAAPEVAPDIDINTELRKVEESAQEVDAVIRKLNYLSDDAEQLDKIVHGIDASIYNSAMIRTILMHTGENLASTHARMRNVVANGVSEITEPLNRVGEALGDSEPLLDPADLRNTLEELENKTGSLGSVVSAIDMLIQDTHSGEVNVDDVQRLAKQLHAISQDNTKLLFSPKLEEKIAASRQ